MSWLLVPCLVALRDEFNTLNPTRDRSSDGSVGDLRHQDRPSDHNPDETGDTPYEDPDSINEVHAIDVDETGPWPRGRDFDDCMEIIRIRHMRGDDNRLQNMIRKRRVTSRTWGWTEWRPYTGSNPHDLHGHFSARYTAAQEADMRPWGLLRRETDDVDEADIEAIANRVMVKLTDKLETAASSAPDDAIVRNLIRIPWQYPGMLERLTKMERGIEDIVKRLPPAPAS